MLGPFTQWAPSNVHHKKKVKYAYCWVVHANAFNLYGRGGANMTHLSNMDEYDGCLRIFSNPIKVS